MERLRNMILLRQIHSCEEGPKKTTNELQEVADKIFHNKG